MNRGRLCEVIFREKEDYLRFMELLREGSTMWKVRIGASCMMPNHYDLMVQTYDDADLSRFMRHGDGVYTQPFNRSQNCDGCLFRGGTSIVRRVSRMSRNLPFLGPLWGQNGALPNLCSSADR
jgi:REP element-mobilizing transposase RayT